MVPRGGVPEDVSYILLDTHVIPRLDLTNCRPTELPVLPDTTPTPKFDSTPPGHEGTEKVRHNHLSPVRDKNQTGAQPLASENHVKEPVQIPELRTLVVDMRDLEKYSPGSSNRTLDNDSSEGHVVDSPIPYRAARRSGGVLKGGGEYISTGEQRPRPRVSFLLDAAPGQVPEGGATQIRVYAKPLQEQDTNRDVLEEPDLSVVSQQRFAELYIDPALPNGLHRYRLSESPDRRHSAPCRQQTRTFPAEVRQQEPGTKGVRSAENTHRSRRSVYEESNAASTTYASMLPSMTNGFHASRRNPVFSFKKTPGAADAAYTHGNSNSRKEARGRRSFSLPPNAGNKQVKGHVRFHEEDAPNGVPDRLSREESSDRLSQQPRQTESRSSSQQRGLGTYSISEHPPRAVSCKPPLPRPSMHAGLEPQNSSGQNHVNSASSRSGRVREWLSVDTVPSSSLRNKSRPSTVSSASSSTRSRDISSAVQRLAGSSRASSASVKAGSDPGPDLNSMDLVTLNLMARRAKGPSRYRYLAKLRSLNLNTPRPLD